MAGERSGRAAWMGDLARGFREYLADQSEVDLIAIDAPGGDVVVALERFDLALGQLADMAVVYGDDSRAVLDPLVVPAAALAGEYLRGLAGAAWVEPDPELPPDDTLLVVLVGGGLLDLHVVARSAFSGFGPSLGAALVARLAAQRAE